MSTQIAVLHPPSKPQIAKAIAAGLPSELSQSPLLGILGVVMGAGIVTLTGRMLTLGTADLKGSLGIGFDDGAWIGSAYNVALMFIGPFTVYLGGLLGARKVLLLAAASFTVICAFLPFIHSYSLLLTALVLAGLTSGTFYPLTLTFALKNIPPRFLPFTLALYATCSRWRREHSSITLRLVSRPPLLPLDVLDLRRPHAHHGPLHLLRRSRSPAEKIRCLSAQLRGFPLRQRWLRTALCRAGSRPTPRLVALWPLHRAILRRGGFLARVAHPPSPQPQSPRRPSIPAPVEHHSSRLRPDIFPLLPCWPPSS